MMQIQTAKAFCHSLNSPLIPDFPHSPNFLGPFPERDGPIPFQEWKEIPGPVLPQGTNAISRRDPEKSCLPEKWNIHADLGEEFPEAFSEIPRTSEGAKWPPASFVRFQTPMISKYRVFPGTRIRFASFQNCVYSCVYGSKDPFHRRRGLPGAGSGSTARQGILLQNHQAGEMG